MKPRIAPELSVRRGHEAVEFYKQAFGATELHRIGGSDENPSVVAQLAIGDATFWVNDESPPNRNHSPESIGGTTVRILLEVDNPAAVVARAIVFGATEISPVGEEHHWLVGRVQDPFGHVWEIARPPEDWPPAAG